MTSEERIRALENWANGIESEMSRLDESLAASAQKIRLLQLGRSGDAALVLIALNVLALVSIAEAVAIVLLWWTR